MSSTENNIKPLIDAIDQIFNSTNDRRIKLFLHMIHREIGDRKNENPLKNYEEIVNDMTTNLFRNVTPSYMKLTNYTLNHGTKNKDYISKEWVIFFYDLIFNSRNIPPDLITRIRKCLIDVTNEKLFNHNKLQYKIIIKILLDDDYKIRSPSNILNKIKNDTVTTTPLDIKTGYTPEILSLNSIPDINNIEELYNYLTNNYYSDYKKSDQKDFTYDFYNHLQNLPDEDETTSSKSTTFFDTTTKSVYHWNGKHLTDDKNQIFDRKNFLQDIKGDKYEKSGLQCDDANKINCDEVIIKCLLGKDLDQCKKSLKDNLLWVDKSGIKNMSPYAIIKFIDILKISKIQSFDPKINKMITKLESFDTWLNGMVKNKKLDEGDASSIKKNEKLSSFLKALIEYVNTEEPVIINKDLNNKQKNTIYENAFIGTTLYKFGLRPNFPRNYGSSNIISFSTINQFADLIKSVQDRMIARLFNNGSPQTGGGFQLGGDNKKMYDDEFQYTYSSFNQYYETLIEMLKMKNKTINKDDMNQIQDYLNNLEISEKNLKKAFRVVHEYANYLNNMGNNKTENLSLEDLEKITEERNSKFQRLVNKQNNGLELLKSLALKVIGE